MPRMASSLIAWLFRRFMTRLADKFQTPFYQLYFDNCLVCGNEIHVYGQYTGRPDFSLRILKNNTKLRADQFQVVHCRDRPDFLVRIKDEHHAQEDRYTFLIGTKVIHKMVRLRDPLTDRLSPASLVVATMVMNEEARISEWIAYQFLLGVEKIVIFLNNSTDGTLRAIEDLSNPNVLVIPFNYSAFPGWHWNNVQRIQLSLSANVLRKFAKWVCFIDVDEFIYLRDHASRAQPLIQSYLEDFSSRHPQAAALRIDSYFFTNEQHDYAPCQYVVAACQLKIKTTGYSKIIVKSERLAEFTVTPHQFSADIAEPTSSIYIGHYWIRQQVHAHARPQDFPTEFYLCRDIADFARDSKVGCAAA